MKDTPLKQYVMPEKMDNPIDKLFRDKLGERATPPPHYLEEKVLSRVASPPVRGLSFWAWGRRAAVLLWLISLGLGLPDAAPQAWWPEQGGVPAAADRQTASPRSAPARIPGLALRKWAAIPPAKSQLGREVQVPGTGWRQPSVKGRVQAATAKSRSEKTPHALAVAVKMPPRGYFAGEGEDTGRPQQPLNRYARQQWKRLRRGEKPTLPEQWKEKPILAFNLPRW